jgi:3-isopropylmalate/(R)-2-methylmalate dehydratase small subunit
VGTVVNFKKEPSRAVLLPLDDVDTDQIIPARYLKTTEKDGLGIHLFADWRYLPDGEVAPDFALNQPAAKGASVLVVGENFGCGSSREHAPWALVDWGFRAVIAQSFADIFRANALKNGLLPISVEAGTHAEIVDTLIANPDTDVTIDLDDQKLVLSNGPPIEFPIDPFAKRILLEGIDELDYIRSFEDEISAYELEHD